MCCVLISRQETPCVMIGCCLYLKVVAPGENPRCGVGQPDQAATLQAELLYHSLDDEKYKAGWSSPAKTLIQVSTLHSRPVLEVLPGAFRMSVDPQN